MPAARDVGITSLAIVVSGFQAVTTDAAANQVALFAQTHPNVLLLAQVPILAAISRLLFWSDARGFAEYLVLAAYTVSMRAAFVAIVALPVWYVVRHSPSVEPSLVGAYWALWFAYFGIAAMQFHARRRVWHGLGGAAIAAAAQYVSLVAINALAYLVG
jgi:hypothetical protein